MREMPIFTAPKLRRSIIGQEFLNTLAFSGCCKNIRLPILTVFSRIPAFLKRAKVELS